MIWTRRKWVVALALSSAAPAYAQSAVTPDNINPTENVQDRVHPLYEPLGVHVGSWTLSPSVTAKAVATDNYRATRKARQSNIGALLRPELTWRSGWLRHKVSGNVYVQQTLNSPLNEENSLTYGGRASGLLEIDRDSEIKVNFAARREVEDRRYIGSFDQSVEPVYFTVLQAGGAGARRFGNLELSVNGAGQKVRYGDAKLADGSDFSQDFRDYRNFQFGGAAAYQMNNGIAIEAAVQHTDTDYAFGPGDPDFIPGLSIDRDSKGQTLTLGVRLELSSLIYGSLRAGYMRRDVRDPKVRDVSGLTYEGDILWNVTPLTSLVFRGRRWVDPSGSVNSAGIERSDFTFEAHHELYRNLLLTAHAQTVRFRGVGGGQKGEEYHTRMGARYRMNRNISLLAGLEYSMRNSNITTNEYNAWEGSLGVRFAL